MNLKSDFCLYFKRRKYVNSLGLREIEVNADSFLVINVLNGHKGVSPMGRVLVAKIRLLALD